MIDITEARVEAVANIIIRRMPSLSRVDLLVVIKAVLEADEQWLAENSKTNDPFEVTSELLDFERQLRGKP
jgi:hypothetical protein